LITYLNGDYLEKEQTRIDPDDRGFLFSDGVYEVVRFYNNRPFRSEEHQKRMEYGLQRLRFSNIQVPKFSEIVLQLQERNNLSEVASSIVYIQVTRGAVPRSHSFPPKETPRTIYGFAKEFKSHVDEQENGANAIAIDDERWTNCDIKSIALLPNTLAHQQARDNNSIEAIFVRDGAVQEGTHCNVMIVLDGIVKTPPLSNFLLKGISRTAILELCDKISIPFSEESVLKSDLYKADEVLLVGTTVEVTPLIRVNDVVIGNGKPGPITQQIQQAFQELVHS